MTLFKQPINQILISDFYSQYKKSPKPVFIWDTCSLLDIIRLPIGTKLDLNLNSLKTIIMLNKDISSDSIYSVCSNLTTIEWDEHVAPRINEADKFISDNLKYYQRITELHNYFYSLEHSPIIANKIVQELSDLADKIISKTIVLNTSEIADLALIRVAKKKRPSSISKKEFKDCAIWETAIEVSRMVNEADKVSLFSTNPSDFIDSGFAIPKLYKELQSEATAVNLMFFSTFEEVAKNFSYKL